MSEQLALGFGPRDEFNAAGFVASPCNADARAALENWQAWPGHALALIGPAGSGKTHLARIWQDRTGAVLIDARRIGETLDALSPDAPVVVENADRGVDEDGLFHLINRAGQDTLPGLLLTGRTAPASWPVNTPDLRSRLAAMPVADICTLSSSSAWAGSRYWRRNTRSRYFAWNAVIDGSIPCPVTSPITAATRVGATRTRS